MYDSDERQTGPYALIRVQSTEESVCKDDIIFLPFKEPPSLLLKATFSGLCETLDPAGAPFEDGKVCEVCFDLCRQDACTQKGIFTCNLAEQ